METPCKAELFHPDSFARVQKSIEKSAMLLPFSDGVGIVKTPPVDHDTQKLAWIL